MGQGQRPVIFLQESELPPVSLPGRVVRAFVGRDRGAERLSTGTVAFPAHSVSQAHVHEDSEEALYVLEGRGAIVCQGESFALTEGSFVFIPPGIRHEVHNTGDVPIKFFYVFSPPVVIGSW